MENVILTVHLILALVLTGVVLLQRSEGGGLGMGGGGGGAGGVMSGRQAANALSRATWILGVAIFATSLGLTILAARQANNSSIMDQFGGTATQQAPATGLPGLPAYTPPPTTEGNPLTPPGPDAPAAGAATMEEAAGAAAPQAVTPPAAQAPATEAPAAQVPATEAPAAEAPAADAVAPPAATAPEAAPEAAPTGPTGTAPQTSAPEPAPAPAN